MNDELESWLRNDERREELRLSAVCTVHVQFPEESTEESDSCPFEPCPTIDFSANGVQIASNKSLIAGAIMPVIVEVSGEAFSLVGEVMWCREPESGGYQIGLHLIDSDDSAVVEWKEAMVNWLKSS